MFIPTTALPRSRSSVISESLSGYAMTLKSPEEVKPSISRRLCTLLSLSTTTVFIRSTSVVTAYPKIKSCITGSTKIIAFIRGSLNTCMNSLIIRCKILSPMIFLSHILLEFFDSSGKDNSSKCKEEKYLPDQNGRVVSF